MCHRSRLCASGSPGPVRTESPACAGYDVQYKVGITGTYDGQPPLISDTIPSDGSVITTAWPVISATLHDPQLGNLSPASGVY
jgi:hypothetical protein